MIMDDRILNDYELDRLIGEKVMGWKVLSHWDADGTIKHLIDENQCEVIPPEFKKYSTDISAAWEVVEKVSSMPSMDFELNRYADMDYGCTFASWHSESTAQSAPFAICLAALEATGCKG